LYEALIEKKMKSGHGLKMEALQKNNTLKLVTLPPEKNLLGASGFTHSNRRLMGLLRGIRSS